MDKGFTNDFTVKHNEKLLFNNIFVKSRLITRPYKNLRIIVPLISFLWESKVLRVKTKYSFTELKRSGIHLKLISFDQWKISNKFCENRGCFVVVSIRFQTEKFSRFVMGAWSKSYEFERIAWSVTDLAFQNMIILGVWSFKR